MKINAILAAALVSLATVNVAGAAVIDNANVNGLKTFRDTTSNRVWLDMDNFFSPATGGNTGEQMMAAAQAAGFTLANRDDVHALLDPLPLSGGQWSGYASVMGFGAPRQLIWGMYEDGGSAGVYGWAYAWSNMGSWAFNDSVYDASTLVNSGDPSAQDLGLFAYQVGSSDVPEPGSLALLGMGIAGLMAARRKRAAK